MPLKSCLKKPCAPEVTFASPLEVGPSVLSAAAVAEVGAPVGRKRFDLTTVLLVVVVVGLVFGCILIFLLFRLRRMELQLQQTTKNFNMQTVRELIAQEIQDTVDQLEAELDGGGPFDIPRKFQLKEPETGPEPAPFSQEGHFILPIPNIQELNNIFENLMITEMMGAPVQPPRAHESKIEEIVEENVAQTQTRIFKESEVVGKEAQHVHADEAHIDVAGEAQHVHAVEAHIDVAGEAQHVHADEAQHVHAGEAQHVHAGEAHFAAAADLEAQPVYTEEPSNVVVLAVAAEEAVPVVVEDKVLSNAEVCFDTISEASSVAGSPKVPSKRTRRTPAPRGKRKKAEKADDVPTLDIEDL